MKSTIGERLVVEKYPSNVVQEHIARYRFAAKYSAGKRVLDIACGTGYGSKILLESEAEEVVGVDVSKEAVSYAIGNYQTRRLEFLVGDCQSIPFSNQSFDLVVSFETLEHIDCYREFVAEIDRVLKKDGVLIVSTPNKALCSPGSENPLNPYHVKEFTLSELSTLMGGYFANVNIFGMKISEEKKGLVSTVLDKIPIRIKYVMPIYFQTFLSKILRKKICLDDVVISKNCLDEAKFFVAVCSNANV